jgi:hypothetical protein
MDQQHPIDQNSVFINLPAELKNTVYGYVLTATGSVTCASYEKDGQTDQKLVFGQQNTGSLK